MVDTPAVTDDGKLTSTGCLITEKSPGGLAYALKWLNIDLIYDPRLKRNLTRGECLSVNDNPGMPATIMGWSEFDDGLSAHVRSILAMRCAVPVRIKGKLVFKPYTLSATHEWPEFINAINHRRRVDMFLNWVESLPPWDGKPRLNTWLEDLFYFPEDADERTIGLRRWVSRAVPMTAIARALSPGYKVDETPVLIGPQGTGKSSAFACLLPPGGRMTWFADALDFSSEPRKIIEGIAGRVIVEFGEAVGLRRSDIPKLKAFLSCTNDGQHRLAWRRDPVSSPRMAAFVITTNDDSPLPNDPTGNRRFVVTRLCPEHKQAKHRVETILGGIRNSLWAEALARVRAHEKPNLPRELKEQQIEVNESARHRDLTLEQSLADELPDGAEHPGMTLEQIARRVKLHIVPGTYVITFKPWAQVGALETNRLRTALINAGWRQTEKKKRGGASDTQLVRRWYTR